MKKNLAHRCLRFGLSTKLFLFFSLFILSNAFAQNPVWVLPTNDSNTSKYFDWPTQSNQDLPTTDPLTGQPYTDPDDGYMPSYHKHRGAANGITGVNGELIFFVVGQYIFDREGRTIFNGDDSFFGATSGCGGVEDYTDARYEISIVPDPGNCNRFYLFKNVEVQCNEEPYTAAYYLLDISVSGVQPYSLPSNPPYYWGANLQAQGQIVEAGLLPNQFLNEQVKGQGSYFAVTDINPITQKSYLFLKKNNSFHTGLYVYEVAPSGVTFVQSIYLNQEFPETFDNFSRGSEIEVKQNQNGDYTLAVSGYYGMGMFVYDHNDMTQSPSFQSINYCNDINFNPREAVGLEFSPNGRYIYQSAISLTNDETCNNPIVLCWDTQTNSFVSLPWVSNIDEEFKYSFIEENEGNLYMIKNDVMAEIVNPDDPLNSTWNPVFKTLTYPSTEYNVGLEQSHKRYTLPDQIDGADYDNFMTSDPSCCIAGTKFDQEIFNAHTDNNFPTHVQIWTPTNNPLNNNGGAIATIEHELNIPAGYEIIIKDMIIKFHPQAELNVRRGSGGNNGGRLTLDGSVLTTFDDCGETKLWKGVDVEGYPNLPQVPITGNQQGYFEVLNKSKVEYAYVGAEAIQNYPNSSSVDPNYAGGIIRTANSTWRNNQIDIRLQNYNQGNSSHNMSYISNSKFVTDEILNPQPKQIVHINLFDVKNVLIRGNEFINAVPNLYAEQQRGYGILSIASKFYVEPYTILPGVSFENSFTNLTFGIYAKGGNTFNNSKVHENVFTNNQNGVVFVNMDFSYITKNTFEIAENSLNHKTVGIHLAYSTGYKVEANVLQSMSNTTSVGQSYGIVVDNSGEANNRIYKNELFNLLVGGQSQRINAPAQVTTPNVSEGLKWQCNNFKQNVTLTDLALTSGRIDAQQGITSGNTVLPQYAGARNLFSHDVPEGTGQNDIIVNHIPDVVDYGITYSYYPSESRTEPLPGNYSPIQTNGYIPVWLIPANASYIFNYENSCPSHIKTIGGSTPIPYVENIKGLKEQIATLTEELSQVNQQSLINTINSGNLSNGHLKNLLLSNSPMLSDDVLISYIESNPTNGHLLQVLQANAPLSPAVIQSLNSSSTLSNYWINDFTDNQGVSPYNQLLNDISYLTDQKDEMIDDAIMFYTLIDTTLQSPIDNVITILELETESKYRKQQLVDAYLYKKDLQSATDKNTDLVTDYGSDYFTTLSTERISNTYGLCIVSNIENNPTSKTVIEGVATNQVDKVMEGKAQCYLKEYFNTDSITVYIEDIVPGNSNSRVAGSIEENNPTIDSEDLSFNLYPNPASNILNVSIQGMDEFENIQLEIISVTGQKILVKQLQSNNSSIDLGQIAKGVYYVLISNASGIMKSEKLIIQ